MPLLATYKPLERCKRVPGHVVIRGGMGLGDALYVQSVARHMVEQGQKVQVCSAWPDVFKPLGDQCVVTPFTRLGVDKVAHYTMRKMLSTTQFEDCCIQAGIKKWVDLRLDWVPKTHFPIATRGKPVVLVALPRTPMGRTDGFGCEVLPDCGVIQKVINKLRGRVTLVQIGKGVPLFQFSGIDHDLSNKTSVSELLDLAHRADGMLGYCSYMVPLAESFDKPALFVWSRGIARSPHAFVRAITPQKVLFKKSCKYLWDDCTDEQMQGALNAFL